MNRENDALAADARFSGPHNTEIVVSVTPQVLLYGKLCIRLLNQ